MSNKVEKKVKIKIPMTRTEKDDVFVGLNGKTYLIKRGVEVEVPAGVAEILKRRDDMILTAMAYEEYVSDKNSEENKE